MVRVVVANSIAAEIAARLGEVGAAVELLVVDRDGSGAMLDGADALLRWDIHGKALRRVLETAPNLRWVHSGSAGVENLPFEELRRRGIVLSNAAGVFAIPIAEWVLAAMLMAVKCAHAMHDAQREHRWASHLELDELFGKTLLILGTGGIGQEVARRAAGFGMRIWGMNRGGRPVDHVERIVAGDGWRALLPEADFVVVTLPLTAETRSMIGRAEIQSLKPSAWLLNVGRGATIDEPALLEALQAGTIGGAAIDAWAVEPLPADHPAWTTPNLIVWPHHSGGSPMNTRRSLDLFMQNLGRFARGEDLLNVVDLEAGY